MKLVLPAIALLIVIGAPAQAQRDPQGERASKRGGGEISLTEIIDGLSKAIQRKPNDPAPVLKRGLYYLWQKFDYEKALRDFERVLELDPNNVTALIGRADVYTGQDARLYDPKKAAEDAERAVQIAPTNSDAYRIRGDIPGHGLERDMAQGMEDYHKAIELNPENMLAYLGLAQNHAQEGKFHDADKALGFAKKAIEVGPGESVALQVLAQILGEEQATEKEALNYINRAIALNPNNGSAYLSRAHALMGNDEAIREEASNIMKACAKMKIAPEDLILGNSKHFKQALMGLGPKSVIAQALRDLDEAERLCPYDDDVFAARGMALEAFPGMQRAALNNYNKAAELNSKSVFNLLRRVEFLTKHPQFSLTEEDLEAAREEKDNNLAARMKDRLGELAGSLLKDCDRALEIDPRNAQAYFLRGTIKASIQMKYESGIEDINKAIELTPDDARYYRERADVHDSFGRTEQAEADREKASELESID